MSRTADGSKLISVGDIKALYRLEEDTIVLVLDNEYDAHSESAFLPLAKNTDFEKRLRRVFIQQGLIEEKEPKNRFSISSIFKNNTKKEFQKSDFTDEMDSWVERYSELEDKKISLDPLVANIGITEELTMLSWDVNKDDHALVIGRPGTGRMMLEHVVITHMLNHEKIWNVSLINAFSDGLYHPFVRPPRLSIYDGIEDIKRHLEFLVTEKSRRNELMKDDSSLELMLQNNNLKRHALIVDDLSSILYSADSHERYEIEELIDELTSGNSVGIHLLIGTENSGSSSIPLSLVAHVSLHITMSSLYGHGQGIARNQGGNPQLFQTFMIETKDQRSLPANRITDAV